MAGVRSGAWSGGRAGAPATPRGGRLRREAMSALGAENAEEALERGSDALRARFEQPPSRRSTPRTKRSNG